MFEKTITLENPYEPELICTKAHTVPNIDDFLEYPNNLNFVSIYIPRINESIVSAGVVKNLQYKDINFGNYIVSGAYLQKHLDKDAYMYQRIDLSRLNG